MRFREFLTSKFPINGFASRDNHRRWFSVVMLLQPVLQLAAIAIAPANNVIVHMRVLSDAPGSPEPEAEPEPAPIHALASSGHAGGRAGALAGAAVAALGGEQYVAVGRNALIYDIDTSVLL